MSFLVMLPILSVISIDIISKIVISRVIISFVIVSVKHLSGVLLYVRTLALPTNIRLG